MKRKNVAWDGVACSHQVMAGWKRDPVWCQEVSVSVSYASMTISCRKIDWKDVFVLTEKDYTGNHPVPS